MYETRDQVPPPPHRASREEWLRELTKFNREMKALNKRPSGPDDIDVLDDAAGARLLHPDTPDADLTFEIERHRELYRGAPSAARTPAPVPKAAPKPKPVKPTAVAAKTTPAPAPTFLRAAADREAGKPIPGERTAHHLSAFLNGKTEERETKSRTPSEYLNAPDPDEPFGSKTLRHVEQKVDGKPPKASSLLDYVNSTIDSDGPEAA